MKNSKKYTITIDELNKNFDGDENEFLNFIKRFSDYTEYRLVRENSLVGVRGNFIVAPVINVYCK